MHLDDLDDRHDRGLQYDLATLWRLRRVLQLFSGVALAAMTGRSDDNDGDRATSTATPELTSTPASASPSATRTATATSTLAAVTGSVAAGYAASLVVGI